jgi:hypothetical protein
VIRHCSFSGSFVSVNPSGIVKISKTKRGYFVTDIDGASEVIADFSVSFKPMSIDLFFRLFS